MAGRFIPDAQPNLFNGPPPEFQDEDVFAWIRRQSDPKRKTRNKKNAAGLLQQSDGKNQNRGGN